LFMLTACIWCDPQSGFAPCGSLCKAAGRNHQVINMCLKNDDIPG
jgi:hypothetical protein